MNALPPYGKILVIEDNPLNLLTLKAIITRQGIDKNDIDTASDSATARKQLTERTYRLIITDFDLGSNGQGAGPQLIREIRNDSAHPNFNSSIIVYTSSVSCQQDLVDLDLHELVQDFLTKKVNAEKIRLVIKEHYTEKQAI